VTGPGCPGSACPTEESSARVTQGYSFSGGFAVATTVVDPRGNATITRFTPDGFPREVTDALGQTTRQERDAGGRLVRTTDPLGRVTQFAYDSSGNVTSITDPLGNTRTFTYDPTFSKVTSITDPLGNLTTFDYDGQGNLIAITDPEQNLKPPAERLKTTFTYNQAGQPLRTTDPLGNTTTFEYDSTGNLARIIDPLGNATTRTYDLVSRLIAQTDPLGNTTRFSYDALNRLVSSVNALSGVTSFGYDANGNLLTVTDARGNAITHEYDSMDRLQTRTDALARQESYQYDPNGNLTQFTDRKGQVSTFTFDPLNRRLRSNFADGTFTEVTYDGGGRLLMATDSLTGSIAEEYDALDRLLRETTPQGSIDYGYDAASRRTRMTVGGQPPVNYAYDAASRLTQIVQPPLSPVDIQYDALGRRTSLTLPNNVSTSYEYDPASRLTRLAYTGPSGPLGDLTYQHDAAGNRVAVGGSVARTLLPDAVPSASYDAANQQLVFGSTSLAFDTNGNLTSSTDPTGTTSFAWDARNRLVTLSGATTGTFAYDAQGRRIRREIAGELREYQYDGVDIVRERVNGADATYLRTLGIDEAVCRIAPEGTAYYLADALSSTIALTDGGGVLGTTYTYEAFGRTASAGTLSANPFQFTGRENDGAVLHYHRARYYNPTFSRFVSEDPNTLENPDGFNFYLYAINNPLILSDPLGLWSLNKAVPQPSSRLITFLNCMDICTGKPFVVTATTNGVHSDPGHRRGTSVDVRPNQVPSKRVFCCGLKCGSVYALDERSSKKTSLATGDHYHFQLELPESNPPKRPSDLPKCPGGC
jgi:RHS repeat-associated protein